MSITSQGVGRGPGDILSQALLQTGLSTPIKVETEQDFIFPDNKSLLSYDVGTFAGNIVSNLKEHNHEDFLPSRPVINSQPTQEQSRVMDEKPILGSVYSQPVGVMMNMPTLTENCSALCTPSVSISCNDGYCPTMPRLVKLENGMVPLQQASSGLDHSNVELEDLLAIPMDQAELEPHNPPPVSHSSYPVTASINSHTSFPLIQTPPQHSTCQPSLSQASSGSELPELMDVDLFNILGDTEADFLDTLSSDNFNGSAANTSYPFDHNSSSGMSSINPSPFPVDSLRNYSTSAHKSELTTPSSLSLVGSNARQQGPVFNRYMQGPRKVPSPPVRLSRLGNSMIKKHSSTSPTAGITQQDQTGDSDDEDNEDYTTADTYASYVPAKLKLGQIHPDAVVESSSLSSVEAPDIYFKLKLPQDVINSGKLSSLQLESVVYACQQHMNILSDGTRAGFLVGDGAGVGKGRTIAGIIYQNYLEGRKKALWFSVSNDLRLDALRDLKDVGAKKIDVYSLNKFHYGKISGKRNGRVRKGVIFSTYSSLIGESASGGKYKTRFEQLLHWLGSSFEGVIVFDECHKAKNLVPTGSSRPSKTGLTVLQLQKKLPKARIVYCSATGASEPKNMAYMSRLGIWGQGTQFETFQDFIKAVERRGVGAMEIVAIDMKLRGMYMARQLSFFGVTFSINKVELTDKFVEAYDASVKLWVETRRLFQEAADIIGYDKKKLKSMWCQFWASHQRFFKYMCIAAKVPETIRLTKRALEEGKCVVIGLQSTGEARTLEQLERNEGELSAFISTTKGVLETLIKRHFPAPVPESGLLGIDWSLIDNDPTLPQSCRKMRRPRGPRKPRKSLPFQENSNNSDSEDSSGSPERSDSAVESSSDEGERSSEGSGSSSSESEEDADSDVNPFGSDFSEPWLQKKKVKGKSRKRQCSPTSSNPQKRKKNFSIKPPPHSSKKGKTKTGFNSKNLMFEQVQSPDTQSNKSSSPLSSQHGSQSPSIDRGWFSSIAEGINRNFGNVQSLSGTVESSPGPLRGKIINTMDEMGSGQTLLDAMSSRFNSGVAVGRESEMLRNTSVKKMKEDLLNKLELLSNYLPTNTLDELIDGLGGTSCVAEMTGRRGRMVRTLPGGEVQYQLRTEQDVSTELLNIREKKRFMDGEKNVAIISEAASSGISLQADRRAKNQKRRIHITLELPWSADRAIQQFGRTHRSNQVTAPEYVFLISALSGEQRFASIVAKRLESLGALTHGDRRATETRDLSKYNVDTKYGRQALENTIKSIVGQEEPLTKLKDYPEDFFEKCRNCMIGVGLLNHSQQLVPVSIDRDAINMSRFLNRILGFPVQLQNQLFSYFSDTLAAVVQQAKRAGRWDGGILDFGSSGEDVSIIDTELYIGDPAYNTATTQLLTIEVGRGMSFEEALEKLNNDTYPNEGFYVTKKVCEEKRRAVLIKAADSSGKFFCTYRPNIGAQRGHTEELNKFLKKYEAVQIEEGKKWWIAEYESSLDTCIHAFWRGRCRNSAPGKYCDAGLRRKTYYMLGGSMLGVWSNIEGVFNRHPGHNQRMQIIRVKTESKRLVGILVPKSCIEDMRQTLSRIAQQTQTKGTEDNPITVG